VAVSIDEEVIPVSLLHQMFGVGQTILPTGGIKPKFNAVVVADLNVFTDEINDTVLCSLRKVLNFMRLNVRYPIRVGHGSHVNLRAGAS
jgi:hypothetical protein